MVVGCHACQCADLTTPQGSQLRQLAQHCRHGGCTNAFDITQELAHIGVVALEVMRCPCCKTGATVSPWCRSGLAQQPGPTPRWLWFAPGAMALRGVIICRRARAVESNPLIQCNYRNTTAPQAVQSNMVYLPRLMSLLCAGFTARRINADCWAQRRGSKWTN